VLPTIANGRTSWVEVGNIFGETQIIVFLHALIHNRSFKRIGLVHLADALRPAAPMPHNLPGRV
jgi:hypothetical protein